MRHSLTVVHKWAMRGVDNHVSPTNTLCGVIAPARRVRKHKGKVTCPKCKSLMVILDGGKAKTKPRGGQNGKGIQGCA